MREKKIMENVLLLMVWVLNYFDCYERTRNAFSFIAAVISLIQVLPESFIKIGKKFFYFIVD